MYYTLPTMFLPRTELQMRLSALWSWLSPRTKVALWRERGIRTLVGGLKRRVSCTIG